MDQIALRRVGPGVVAAYQVSGGPGSFGENAGSAVAAYVVQDVHAAVVVAQHNQGVGTVVDGDVVARLGQFGGAGGKDPVLAENGLHVDLEDRGIRVEGGIEGVASAPELKQRGDFCQLLGRQ